MEYWKAEGWNEHEIRHWISTRNVPRDDRGKIIRSNRKGKVMSEDKYRRKMELKATIADREDYREAICDCFPYGSSPEVPNEPTLTKPELR